MSKYFRFTTAITLLMLAFFDQSRGQSWTSEIKQPMPERVTNNAVCQAQVGSSFYAYSFGGIDTSKTSPGIHLRSFRYHLGTDSWETLPDLPDTLGKIAAAASQVKDVIYIIGGYHVFSGGGELSSTRVHRFDVTTNSFMSDGADIPVAIDDQVQAVYKDSLIYVVTGWSDNTNVPNVQIYDPANNLWLTGTTLPDNNNFKVFGGSGAILGDTIYYFGGATTGFNFPATLQFVKGYINPADPTQITWTNQLTSGLYRGYRMAAISTFNRIFWIGGSTVTYNFDGIAYNGSGGVDPADRILSYRPSTGAWVEEMLDLPMDLRGAAVVNDRQLLLCGGILENQEVTNQNLLLTYDFPSSSNAIALDKTMAVYPNPATSTITIDFGDKVVDGTMSILTSDGKLVMKKELLHSRNNIQLLGLTPGFYLLHWNANGTSGIKKLLLTP